LETTIGGHLVQPVQSSMTGEMRPGCRSFKTIWSWKTSKDGDAKPLRADCSNT